MATGTRVGTAARETQTYQRSVDMVAFVYGRGLKFLMCRGIEKKLEMRDAKIWMDGLSCVYGVVVTVVAAASSKL